MIKGLLCGAAIISMFPNAPMRQSSDALAVAWHAPRNSRTSLTQVQFREPPAPRPSEGNASQYDVPNAVGVSGQPMPLRITIPPNIDRPRFLSVRSIPKELSLSSGFRLRNAWFVPFDGSQQLQLISPPGFEGNIVLEVFFYHDSHGLPIGRDFVSIKLRSPRAAPDATETSSLKISTTKSPPAPQETNAALAKNPFQLSATEETSMLTRGADLMRRGDIASARLLFKDLAARASARGARAMGESYDPVLLRRVFIAGLEPNLEEARKWYKKAVELGDEEALQRLGALEAQ
jgi:hypothetical protein